jgi:recombination protein RecA
MSKVDILDKKKAMERVIQVIEKQCGKGSMMKLNDVRRVDSNCISTGFIGLDIALGVGGVPRGRVIEVYGPEGSGKSTLALEILAAVQKEGGNAVFIDAEHALDPEYAAKLGVDLDNLFISQPDFGEQALFIADELIRSHAVDIIIIDSVAALTPKAEIEGEIGDSFVAVQARMMSQALRKMTAQINQSGTVVIFINQIREKIGGPPMGNNEVTPGGRALKFYSSLRLEVRKKESLKDPKTGEVLGHRCKVTTKKNKVAPPFRECELEIIYGEGFSQAASILQEALKLNIIERAGSWLSYGDAKLGQGMENAKTYLEEHEDKADEIMALIREQAFVKGENDHILDDHFGTDEESDDSVDDAA